MARCSKCNRSNHGQCKAGSCDCKCRGFFVDGDPQADPDRLSDPGQDKFWEEVNKQWRLAHPVEKKVEPKP